MQVTLHNKRSIYSNHIVTFVLKFYLLQKNILLKYTLDVVNPLLTVLIYFGGSRESAKKESKIEIQLFIIYLLEFYVYARL